MENTNKLQLACFLFLLLILHQQVLFVNGRHLKPRLCLECSNSKALQDTVNVEAHHGAGDEGMSVITDDGVHLERRSRRVELEVDDFRPTTPGHSPGVGHSIKN